MSSYVSVDHIKFLLGEVHDISEVLELDRYKDYDEESIDMLLDSSKQFADQELFPYFTEMDRFGAKFENGSITAHPQIENVLQKAGENGYICAHFDYDEGGSQMPHMAAIAANYITTAANNSAVGYIGLTAGAAGLIRSFASKELFDRYVPNMMAGKWGGTMALTEPQAGSSLSDITTSAAPAADGIYNISGQKIFISAGDHNCAENIVHLVLARIEGAPAGTKGISLFVVPKHRITDDGGLTLNDVTTAGEYEKMGQRSYVTTHLVFGDKNDCQGWLVGEANKGLKYMFQMMNGARIEVGLTASAIASAAYYASLQYAKERPQGRKINNAGQKDINKDQTLIINHPDVRRMLMLQKAIVEGSTSLILLTAKYLDLSHEAATEEERQRYHNLAELLTPITKTYPSEAGQVSISNGMQVLGGYGFTTDFPLEQYYRDVRITAIYEGTTGIQSLDLLGRKVMMQNGAAMMALMEEINKTICDAKTFDDLAPYAQTLTDKLALTQQILGHLMGFAQKGQFERYLSDATIFMDFASTIVIAWQWLSMATSAKQALVTGNMKRTDEFYQAQIHTMRFYFKYEVPKVEGMRETLLSDEVLTIVEEKETVDVFA
ncbi:MAG: acyl-CoA dehydrogenase [Bacteroidota bacterium]